MPQTFPTETLITPRLLLRKCTPETYHHVFEHFNKEEQMSFFGFTAPEALAREQEKYAKGMATYNRTFLYFHLLDKETNELIGWCGFHTWYTEHRRAEIGYQLTNDAYKNKGLMSEAIAPIIAYGFEQMQLNRIEAFVGHQNTASLNIMQKMKFTKEGNMRSHYFKNGVMEDSLVFSLLQSENLFVRDFC